VFLGIVHPEVVALRIGIRHVRTANLLYFVEQGTVSQRRMSQLSPVTPAPTQNYIVDGGEGETLVIKVSVKHGKLMRFYNFIFLPL
jgi:hypothetical protein